MKARLSLRSFSLALSALGALVILVAANAEDPARAGDAAAGEAPTFAEAKRIAAATPALTLDDGTAAKCIYRCNSVVYPTLQACNDACREFADFCVITC